MVFGGLYWGPPISLRVQGCSGSGPASHKWAGLEVRTGDGGNRAPSYKPHRQGFTISSTAKLLLS